MMKEKQMSLCLQRPMAVLFDWDNTIVESLSFVEYVFSRVVSSYYGIEKHDGGYSLALSARALFPKVFGDKEKEATKLFYQYFEECHLEHLKPYEGIIEGLHFLHQRGVKLGIISNKKSKYLKEEIAHLGLESLFSCIIGSGDSLYDKPDPRVVYDALKKMDVPLSSHVWMIGDSDVDIEAAKSAGIFPILFQKETHKSESDVYKINCYNLFFNKLLSFV